jgi:hypothetical protein
VLRRWRAREVATLLAIRQSPGLPRLAEVA